MTESKPMTISELVEEPAVRDLPSSCKLVWLMLSRNGEATRRALRAGAGLSNGEISYAVDRLRSEGLIDKRPCVENGKYIVYYICDE